MAKDSRVGFSTITLMSWVQGIGICSSITSGIASLEEAKSIVNSYNFPLLAREYKDQLLDWILFYSV